MKFDLGVVGMELAEDIRQNISHAWRTNLFHPTISHLSQRGGKKRNIEKNLDDLS